MQHRMRKLPLATITVLVISVAVTYIAVRVPGLADLLRRDVVGLQSGEIWRLVTPLFVQADPPVATLTVWAFLLAIGARVERLFGTAQWLVLYATGAAVGEAVGYAWQPHGSGGSVAVAGLLGGFVAWCLLRPTPWFAKAGAVIVALAAAVDTFAKDIHGLPLLAGIGVGALLLRRSGAGADPVRSCCSPRDGV